MKIIDISRPLFNSPVFPGDPAPKIEWLKNMGNGDEYNLSAVYSCTHTGTHADAPLHYIEKGSSISRLALNNFIGECTVVTVGGMVTGAEMEEILKNAKPRILLRGKGHAFLSKSAAGVLDGSKTLLIGTDALSVAQEDQDRAIHIQLFKSDIAILEGLMLDGVYDGDYFLYAPPVLYDGLEAAPVRAVLIN